MISLGSDCLRQSNLVAKDEFRPVAFTIQHVVLHVPFAVNVRCRPQRVASIPEPAIGRARRVWSRWNKWRIRCKGSETLRRTKQWN
jgi:hypothetical protein